MTQNKLNDAETAVATALSLVGKGVYKLGTGDCDTHPDGEFDCFGIVCKAFNIRRHEPGFNVGPWASVSDDHNYNSAIEDALREARANAGGHRQQHYEPVCVHFTDGDEVVRATYDIPRPGDLLAYPTFRLPGHPQPWIGHGAIVVGVPDGWDWKKHTWRDLTVVQCSGPDGRRPGIRKSTGQHWVLHDTQWPKPQHRSQLIRVRG